MDTTTNGHAVQTGCVLDNHWGWHNHARLIFLAADLGFPLDEADADHVRAYDEDGDEDYMEVVAGQGGIMDDAEQWLNDNTVPTCRDCGEAMYATSDGFYRHVGYSNGRTPCGVAATDTVQHYLWHWHDGDFFLSPYCGGDDDCADDMCACQS